METCDVLVVGAGPTGLVAAVLLKQSGIDVRIVDKASERLEESRALVVQPRTLELMHKLGLAEAMIDAGLKTLQTNFYARGEQLLHVPFGEVAEGETPFPFVLFLSQVETERVLDAELERLGVPIERSLELVRLEQATDGVVARLVRDGVETGLHCQWLIGADGSHSAVRHLLGLPFEGDAYRSDFVLGDLKITEIEQDLAQLHIFLGRVGVCALFPMKGGITRIIATRIGSEVGDGPLTLEELQQTTREFVRQDVVLSDPSWLSRFHLHHRGVPRYREGRCFVAGDAAHIHSPAGAQGMNTGMQDAYNLAWKLAMVLQGHAPESLVDSYHEERHPVGQKLLQFTDRLFSLGAVERPWLTPIRNFLAPHVVPRVAGLGGPERIFRFVSQLGIRYRRSPVVHEDLGEGGAAFKKGPRAGDRAPGVPLIDALVGTGWWLLAFDGLLPQGAERERWRRLVEATVHGRPHCAIRWVAEPGLHGLYGLSGPGLVLVRPDGHIAFRSAGMRVDPLERWYRGWTTG